MTYWERIVQLYKFIEKQIIALVNYLLGILVYPIYLIIKTSHCTNNDVFHEVFLQ